MGRDALKIMLRKASDMKFKELREINSLEDLLALREEFGHEYKPGKFRKEDLIIGHDWSNQADVEITIYDGYVE